jgi:hypothetical protein
MTPAISGATGRLVREDDVALLYPAGAVIGRDL